MTLIIWHWPQIVMAVLIVNETLGNIWTAAEQGSVTLAIVRLALTCLYMTVLCYGGFWTGGCQ